MSISAMNGIENFKLCVVYIFIHTKNNNNKFGGLGELGHSRWYLGTQGTMSSYLTTILPFESKRNSV